MTIEVDSAGILTADYAKANSISILLLQTLAKEPIGYGILGCALTVGRLLNPEVKLSPHTETKFVGDLMEWADAYFTIDVKGVPN